MHLTQVKYKIGYLQLSGEYPRIQEEFERCFASEKAYRQFLFELRWPEGFIRLRCLGRKGWTITRDLLVCKAPGHQAPLTAGTLFQYTRAWAPHSNVDNHQPRVNHPRRR